MKRKKDPRLKIIGDNIKKARKSWETSVRELGTKSSVDYSQIAAIEKGRSQPESYVVPIVSGERFRGGPARFGEKIQQERFSSVFI